MIDPQSVFVKTFGDTPFIRTLDHFLLFDCCEYSKNWLAKELNISRMTMDKIWKQLIDNEIIIKTRTVGRAEMYKLNKKNNSVIALLDFDMKISGLAARKEIISIKR